MNQTNGSNSGALPRPPQSISGVGQVLAQSGFFSDATTQAKAIAKILAGREIGIGPMSAMSHITVARGKVTYSAQLLAWLLEKHPDYDYNVIEASETACEIEFFRGGRSRGKCRWTIEKARRAGLTTKDVWKGYPDDLLFARAMTQGIRRYCPGLLVGAYVPEEFGNDEAARTQQIAHVQAVASVEPPKPTRTESSPQLPLRSGEAAAADGEIIDASFITEPPEYRDLSPDHQVSLLEQARDFLSLSAKQWEGVLGKRNVLATNQLNPEQREELYKAMRHKIQCQQLDEGINKPDEPKPVVTTLVVGKEVPADATDKSPVGASP